MLTACEKDNPTGGDDVEVGTFTATVDGDAMDFSTGAVATESLLDPEWYMVAGADSDNNNIVMNIPADTGNYDLGVQPDDPNLVINLDGTAWTAISGALNISTSTENNLAGAFNGTLTDDQLNTISVDDGLFNVEIMLVNP